MLVQLAYDGPLPARAVRSARRIVARALAKALEWSEADAAVPREVPPAIDPPAPYRRPAEVSVSAKLVAKLRRDYGPGLATDDGRRLGDLPEVREWLSGLRPGKLAPRAAS